MGFSVEEGVPPLNTGVATTQLSTTPAGVRVTFLTIVGAGTTHDAVTAFPPLTLRLTRGVGRVQLAVTAVGVRV